MSSSALSIINLAIEAISVSDTSKRKSLNEAPPYSPYSFFEYVIITFGNKQSKLE